MAGLTENGFQIKRLPEIKEDLEAAFKAEFPDITTDADSVFGQIIGVVAKPISDIWEILELVYLSQWPASAEGFSLDNLVQYIGLTRLQATPTEVVALLLSDTDSTPVPAGTQFSISITEKVFETTANATISKATLHRCKVKIDNAVDTQEYGVEINSIPATYTAGPSDTVQSIAIALRSAINAAVGTVVNAEIDAVDDDTVVITSLDTDQADDGLFGADIDVAWTENSFAEFGTPVDCDAQETGPTECLVGTLDTIDTPVSGLDGVTNLNDGVKGRDVETDTELRIRREQSLSVTGAGTLDAIRSRILQEVENVVSCSVFENRTDVTDGAGRPPHSFQVVAQGGADQDIGDKIWEVKPAGIQTFGAVEVDVEDTNGDIQVMKFDRPTTKYAWVKVRITTNPEEEFPTGGLTTITNAILAYGQTFVLGQDMIYQKFYSSIYSVQGIADADLEIALEDDPGDPPSYVQTNIAVGDTHIAEFVVARIDVAFVP